MERKRELTKILLAESFKELLIKGSFDKITIKMITDQAGVIRPTFYNYFCDKYEVVEWIFNEYIIEKEYLEFISLLKLYVNSQPPSNSIIHLISSNFGIILLDDKLETIELQKNNLKYFSDITFSDNDFILNTLLNILPQKIYLHLVSISPNNFDFINTIKLVFENKITICQDCNICNLYKNNITTSNK